MLNNQNNSSKWRIVRLKNICMLNYGDSLAEEKRIEGEIPVYGSNGIVGKHNKAITSAPCIIIGRKGSYGKVNYSTEPCFPIDTTYWIDKHSTNADLRWLSYILPLLELDKNSQDSAVPGLSREVAYEKKLPLPSYSDQKRIAAYLDEQTAKIDRLMDLRRRQIALLKEQRAALIQQAVTRGLNPNVPMKDSGLPWLGEIPVHWEVMPLKRELKFVTSGSHGWAEHYSDSGKLFLRISNLTRDSIDLDLSDVQLVDVLTGIEGERTRVQKGDLLISITADLGSVAVVPDDIEEAYVSQHVALARPTHRRSLSRWLGYLLISRVGKNQLEMAGLGGTKIQLALDDVKSLLVFILPLNEQIEILRFIEDQQAKFNVLQIAYSRQLTLLAEYRAALIHECVTGRRAVPDDFNPGVYKND